jgi:hypothetical protein
MSKLHNFCLPVYDAVYLRLLRYVDKNVFEGTGSKLLPIGVKGGQNLIG